jgi:CDP-2,3-bis-(O-geranylgeranyl)-sn-glycerol synthase
MDERKGMSITVMDIVYAMYFIFPAYCANAIPVIFGGGRPIDDGRTFLDGKPIFGAHKTFRGFFAGLLTGTLVGILQNVIGKFPSMPLFEYPLLLGFTISLGALFGDLLDSFIKRRLNLSPGAPFPVVDQLDFVVGALLFSLFVSPPFLTPTTALLIIVVTPPIHLLTNFIAYLLGVKKTPW